MHLLFQKLSELLEVNDCLTRDIALEVLQKEMENKELEKAAKEDMMKRPFACLMTCKNLSRFI